MVWRRLATTTRYRGGRSWHRGANMVAMCGGGKLRQQGTEQGDYSGKVRRRATTISRQGRDWQRAKQQSLVMAASCGGYQWRPQPQARASREEFVDPLSPLTLAASVAVGGRGSPAQEVIGVTPSYLGAKLWLLISRGGISEFSHDVFNWICCGFAFQRAVPAFTFIFGDPSARTSTYFVNAGGSLASG
uniref:Uncharacterized protein n=1 Tax=Oryza brachyantha TaxID=4533 RepID=J3M5T3_ORYBR